MRFAKTFDLQAKTIAVQDCQSGLLSLVIRVNDLALGAAFWKSRSHQFLLPPQWVLIALETMFEALNAYNHDEVFPLVNGASIGIGLLLYLV